MTEKFSIEKTKIDYHKDKNFISTTTHLTKHHNNFDNTIRGKIKVYKNNNDNHFKQMGLTTTEESYLLYVLKLLELYYSPITLSTIHNIANLIIKARKSVEVRKIEIHNGHLKVSSNSNVSLEWAKKFIKMNSIKICTAYISDIKRIQADDEQPFKKWLKKINTAISLDDVSIGDIYYVDEISFTGVSSLKTKKPVEPSQNTIGNVTVIECACADGSVLNPMVIFKAKHMNVNLYPDMEKIDLSEWMIRASESDWINTELFRNWVEKFFDRQTRLKANGKTRLLLIGSNFSHINEQEKLFCLLNGIILLLVPAHANDRPHPLDATFFGLIMHQYQKQIIAQDKMGFNQVQKHAFLECYNQARIRAINNEKINSGFFNSGLWPFNPELLYNVLSFSSQKNLELNENIDNPLNFESNFPLDSVNSSINTSPICTSDTNIGSEFNFKNITTNDSTSISVSNTKKIINNEENNLDLVSAPLGEVDSDKIYEQLSQFIQNHSNKEEAEMYVRLIDISRKALNQIQEGSPLIGELDKETIRVQRQYLKGYNFTYE